MRPQLALLGTHSKSPLCSCCTALGLRRRHLGPTTNPLQDFPHLPVILTKQQKLNNAPLRVRWEAGDAGHSSTSLLQQTSPGTCPPLQLWPETPVLATIFPWKTVRSQHQDSPAVADSVNQVLQGSPCVATQMPCRGKPPLTLLAIRDQVVLSFLDHRHIPQGLAKPQYRSMGVTAVHGTSEL